MRNDPIYLFQELTWKASLGVLSVAGNVCRVILAEKYGYVKVFFRKIFEEKVEKPKSIYDILRRKN